MTASVRISAKDARDILAFFHEDNTPPPFLCPTIDRIRAALKPSQKKKLVRKANKAARETKTKSKRDETAQIRGVVFKRAEACSPPWAMGPACEVCRARLASEMHHAMGRVWVKQSERNCLAVCGRCHKRITDNRRGNGRHDAAACWAEVAVALQRLGFDIEAAAAMGEAEYHDAKRKLDAGRARSALSERREGAP